MNNQAPPKANRSRTGCLTCRRRRVKCDEHPVQCHNCLKRSERCEWAESDLSSPVASTSNFEIAIPVPACEACKIAKARCSRESPACSRCREQFLECKYNSRKRRRHHSSTLSPFPTFNGGSPSVRELKTVDRLTSRLELDRLLDAFFRHVYPSSGMSFIHHGHLYRRVEDGSASTLLLQAMGAVSGRFIAHENRANEDGGELPARWAREARMGIIEDLDRFSTAKLATTLCLVHHDYNSGRIGSAWNMTALATRMAQGMGLHLFRSNETGSWTAQETRRRLVWATFCADLRGSGGISEYTTYDFEPQHINLPSTEQEFTFGEQQTPSLDLTIVATTSSSSLSANHIFLVSVGYEVHRYLKELSSQPDRPWHPTSGFHRLRDKLLQWNQSRSPSLQLNLSNLYARKGSQEFGAFFHLHLHYLEILVILHRFTMPGFDETAPLPLLEDAPFEWIEETRYKCFLYARAMAQKISILADKFPEYTPSDWTWHIFAYCSVRHQLVYIALKTAQDQVSGDNLLRECRHGFEELVQVVGKMTKYYEQNRMVVRDIIRMLKRQGCPPSEAWRAYESAELSSSGRRTPVRGPVLSRMPYMRRYLRHPRLDDPQETTQSVEDQILGDTPESGGTIPAQPNLFTDIDQLIESTVPGTTDLQHLYEQSAPDMDWMTVMDQSIDWQQPFTNSGTDGFSFLDFQTLDALSIIPNHLDLGEGEA